MGRGYEHEWRGTRAATAPTLDASEAPPLRKATIGLGSSGLEEPFERGWENLVRRVGIAWELHRECWIE